MYGGEHGTRTHKTPKGHACFQGRCITIMLTLHVAPSVGLEPTTYWLTAIVLPLNYKDVIVPDGI